MMDVELVNEGPVTLLTRNLRTRVDFRPARSTHGQKPTHTRRKHDMRVMVLVKASEQSEAGEMPSEQLLSEMMAFNEELVKAGVMLPGEGLHPTSAGARAIFPVSER